MARIFGKQDQPKPKRNPAMADVKNMRSETDDFIDGVASGGAAKLPPALNSGKETPPPSKKSAPPPKPDTAEKKGMGIGKPLLSKGFTDGDDKFKITVTKEK